MLITRAPARVADWIEPLRAAGWDTLACAAISVEPLAGAVLPSPLERFDWIVFTSGHGVRFFVDALAAGALERPSGAKIAVVGPGTARAAEAAGLSPAWVADPADAAGLAARLAVEVAADERVLRVRPQKAAGEVAAAVAAAGAICEDAVLYRTVDGPGVSRARHALVTDEVAAAVITSPSSLAALTRGTRNPDRLFAGATVVALGPSTARALAAAGIDPVKVARSPDAAGVVAALGEA